MGKYKELKKEVTELRQKVESLKPYNWPSVENLEVQFEQVNELPEKWFIRWKTIEEWRVIKKYFIENSWGFIIGAGAASEKYDMGDRYIMSGEDDPEGYTEITFDTFKRLVLKEEEKPEELEKRKWYKAKDNELIFYALDVLPDYTAKGYGIGCWGDWEDDDGKYSWGFHGLVPATEEEVSAALIKEAERRGFKEGVTVSRKLIANELEDIVFLKENDLDKWRFFPYENSLEFYGLIVFEKGKWAEIIEPKEQPIDWSVPGQLVKSTHNENCIVLTSGSCSKRTFEGMCLTWTHNPFRDSWEQESFTLCTEPITLQN